MVERLGQGWVGEEALAIALYSVLAASSTPGSGYREAMAIAANHDGDSDSTASIAGQIWGAWRGLDGIPHEWIADIDVLAPLLSLSRSMTAALSASGAPT